MKPREPRWIAPEILALIMALVLVLPDRYQVFSPVLRYGLIGMATLLLVVWAAQPRDKPESHTHALTGHVAVGLFAFVILSALFKLIYDMLYRPDYVGGLPLLFAGVSLWLSNAIVFGIWYWLVDRGGPEPRENPNAPPELLFPQMTTGIEPDWKPRFFDYIFVAFTTSTDGHAPAKQTHEGAHDAASAHLAGDHRHGGGARREYLKVESGRTSRRSP